jgi:hypothetical protein
VGEVCEEKQKITKEWEKFVRKSRRSQRSGRKMCEQKQKIHQGVGEFVSKRRRFTKEWSSL